MDPDVPLVVPEINPAAARNHMGIVACPNHTIVTVMPLKPLHDLGRLKRVVATSFQAVSGAGVNGIAELREQTMAWSKGEPIKSKFFAHQIAFNLIPAGDFVEGGYTGEEIEAGQRDQEDPRPARAADSRRPRCGCRSSPRIQFPSTPRPSGKSRRPTRATRLRTFRGYGCSTIPRRIAIRCRS